MLVFHANLCLGAFWQNAYYIEAIRLVVLVFAAPITRPETVNDYLTKQHTQHAACTVRMSAARLAFVSVLDCCSALERILYRHVIVALGVMRVT